MVIQAKAGGEDHVIFPACYEGLVPSVVAGGCSFFLAEWYQLTQYFTYPKNNYAVIKDCLGITANHLAGLPNPPLILIIFDGIEEIVEFSLENYQKSISSRLNLLWRFENTFLTPLLKYPNVRIISSRRSKEAHWKSYTIKK